MNDWHPRTVVGLNRRVLLAKAGWVFAAVLWAVAVATLGVAAERETFLLLEGTRWETPCFVHDTGRDGPTVLIVGGIHGNEPAGATAAEQIRHWPLTRGKLLVVPRANVPGLRANRRFLPQAARPLRDLNRNFPRTAEEAPRGEPAGALWKLLVAEQPDWLLDLHEGYDFHLVNSDSVGSTVIRHRSPDTDRASRRMVQAINATIDVKQHKFQSLAPPAQGALARAAGEHLGIRAMILETTRKDQPLSLRSRQHRIMVYRLLEDLQMIDDPTAIDPVAERETADGCPLSGCRQQLDSRDHPPVESDLDQEVGYCVLRAEAVSWAVAPAIVGGGGIK